MKNLFLLGMLHSLKQDQRIVKLEEKNNELQKKRTTENKNTNFNTESKLEQEIKKLEQETEKMMTAPKGLTSKILDCLIENQERDLTIDEISKFVGRDKKAVQSAIITLQELGLIQQKSFLSSVDIVYIHLLKTDFEK